MMNNFVENERSEIALGDVQVEKYQLAHDPIEESVTGVIYHAGSIIQIFCYCNVQKTLVFEDLITDNHIKVISGHIMNKKINLLWNKIPYKSWIVTSYEY